MNQLFRTKSLALLMEEMAGENRLRRVLGPVQLTQPGRRRHHRRGHLRGDRMRRRTTWPGPSLMLSYVLAGMTCIFAALCYAEFASMVPVAGSAYTYAYATLGELFAWIIGWDLVLEYAVGSATVANGWSGYFQSVLAKFGIHLPAALSGPPIIYDAAAGRLRADRRDRQPAGRAHRRRRDLRAGEGHSGERELQRHHGRREAGRRAVRHSASARSTSIRTTGRRLRRSG